LTDTVVRPQSSSLRLRMRDWFAPVLVFVAARVVSILLLVHLAAESQSEPPYTERELMRGIGSDPLSVVTYWDGRWYEEIATHGYPEDLPRQDGEVIQNAWAFYPVYPFLARMIMLLGLSFNSSALILSLVLGGAAMLVLYRMLLPNTGAFTALVTVAAFSFGPTSPVLQVAYTEGLALLLVLGSLWALRERRYVLSGGLALVLSLSRPIAPALAATMGVIWIARWLTREREEFSIRERVRHAVLAVGTAATFVVWPLFCGVATGELDAYAQTQQAWEVEYEGWRTWVSAAFMEFNPAAMLIVVCALGGAWWIAARKGAAGWGADLRIWVAIYPLFILAVSRPTTSIFRYLMLTALPAWPLPDVSARITSLKARVALFLGVVLVATTLQYLWTKAFFATVSWFP